MCPISVQSTNLYSGSIKYLTTPSFTDGGESYPPNQHCTCKAKAIAAGYTITSEILYLDMKYGYKCEDFINFYYAGKK